MQALSSFKKLYPGHRHQEIEGCIERAAMFIEKIQAPDGSWFVLCFLSSLSSLTSCSKYQMCICMPFVHARLFMTVRFSALLNLCLGAVCVYSLHLSSTHSNVFVVFPKDLMCV